MADTETIVAEPEAIEGLPADFGNIAEEMNRQFPGTAPKPDAAPAKEPVSAAPVVPVEPVKAAPVVAPAAPADGLPPDAAFGEKAPVVPAKEPEVQIEAPKYVKDNPAALKNWNELSGRYTERGKTIAKLEGEVASLREKVVPADEGMVARLAEQEAIIKDYSERIAVADLSIQPEFQQQFIFAREKLVADAMTAAKDAGVDPADVERAMSLSGKSRTDALDEIVRGIDSPTMQGELGAIIKDINRLDRNKSAALADSKGNLERLKQHAKAQEFEQGQRHAKYIDKAIDAMVDAMGNYTENGVYKGCAFLRKIDGNETWNKNVDGYVQRAKDVATNSKDERLMLQKIVLGEAAPDIYEALLATRRELQKERALNAEYKSADPGLNGGRPLESGGDAPIDKNLTFGEAAAARSGLP